MSDPALPTFLKGPASTEERIAWLEELVGMHAEAVRRLSRDLAQAKGEAETWQRAFERAMDR